MRLLVSVRNRQEAAAALEGGADFIDAKDPAAGALGAVSLDVFTSIHATIAGARPVTAALGDAENEASIEHAARIYARAGASLVKIGFAGVTSRLRIDTLIAAAVRGTGEHASVIAVAYADADRVASLNPFALVQAAAHAGAAGVLLDTADKHGPALSGLMSPPRLRWWVVEARDAGLLVALAGKLTIDDVSVVHDAGADIVGVRGAACEGGRMGPVAAARVRELRSVLARCSITAPAPDPAAACE